MADNLQVPKDITERLLEISEQQKWNTLDANHMTILTAVAEIQKLRAHALHLQSFFYPAQNVAEPVPATPPDTAFGGYADLLYNFWELEVDQDDYNVLTERNPVCFWMNRPCDMLDESVHDTPLVELLTQNEVEVSIGGFAEPYEDRTVTILSLVADGGFKSALVRAGDLPILQSLFPTLAVTTRGPKSESANDESFSLPK